MIYTSLGTQTNIDEYSFDYLSLKSAEISIKNMKSADKTVIIALTANAFDEDVQRSLQAGLNAHLSKPVQAETLFETLESLVKD